MTIKKKIYLVLILFILIGITFYMKAAPYFVQSQVFFMVNKESLDNTVKFFNEHKELKTMHNDLSGGFTFKNINDEPLDIISKDELQNFNAILSITPIRRLPKRKRITFFLGSLRKFNKTFHISYDYVFDSENIDIECNKNYTSQIHGVCNYLLDTHWVLRYEWNSI